MYFRKENVLINKGSTGPPRKRFCGGKPGSALPELA